MKYFFLPGRLNDLSKAELKAITETFLTGPYQLSYPADNLIILETSESEVKLQRIFKRLGGHIKFGRVIDTDISFEKLVEGNKKVVFGVSVHSNYSKTWDSRKIKDLSEVIKDQLKASGFNPRYILPSKSTYLNSAQVIKRKLLEKGFELNIWELEKETVWGVTLAEQDVDIFSFLEYGKPFTDKKMGVLPTKLARIMINLTGVKKGVIWDPFCGSGTILLESLISGYDVLGSDIDPEAVEGTIRNIEWFGKTSLAGSVKYDVFEFDVVDPNRKVVNQLMNSEFDAIVCEPYMGPPQFKILSETRAKELLENVKSLYEGLFSIIAEIKKPNISVVMIMPSYRTANGWVTTSVLDMVGKRWVIENKKYGEHLHWDRTNSMIRRNIFVLKRKK